MKPTYEVSLVEDQIIIRQGQVVHHPLNGPYTLGSGKNGPSYGLLTFGGHDLDKSPLLADIKVFYLEFFGEPDHMFDREAWADPLRTVVLQRLCPNSHAWYLSCLGNILSGPSGENAVAQQLRRESFKTDALNHIVVQSEKPYGSSRGMAARFFFEVPDHLLADVVSRYWSQAVPGYPIEGYNMPEGNIALLREWDARPRDAQLFLEVMQEVYVAFYTCPAEHRHFVFLSNKLTLGDMERLLDIESLQRTADELASQQ